MGGLAGLGAHTGMIADAGAIVDSPATDPRTGATLIQLCALALALASILWSDQYARFVIKSWRSTITEELLEDMVAVGARLAELQAVAFTLLALLVNLVVSLAARTSDLRAWQVIMVGAILPLCLLGVIFSFTFLPATERYEELATGQQEKKAGLWPPSYRQVAWGLVLLGNVAVLLVIWTLP